MLHDGQDREEQEKARYVFVPLVMDDDDRQIHAGLLAIGRERMGLDAREIALLQRAEDKQLHRKRGHAGLVHYMECELGYARHTAYEYLRMAEALKHLPLCNEALWDRDVPLSKLREITRIATPDTEYDWLEAARSTTVRDLEKLVSGRKPGDRPEDPSDPQLRPSLVRFEVLPARRAMLAHTRNQFEHAMGKRLSDDEFIEALCRAALEPGAHVAEHPDGSGRPAYQTSITTCRDCKRSWTSDGGVDHDIDPATLEKAQCDAEHIGDLEAASPARMTRTVTKAKRRLVFARDGQRCSVPGCHYAHGLDIHHLVFQAHGGKHVLSNLILLCSVHHQLLHEKKLVITGKAPDALTFTWVAATEDADDDSIPKSHVGRANLDDVPDDRDREPTWKRPTRTEPHRESAQMPTGSQKSHVGPEWESEIRRFGTMHDSTDSNR